MYRSRNETNAPPEMRQSRYGALRLLQTLQQRFTRQRLPVFTMDALTQAEWRCDEIVLPRVIVFLRKY